MKLFIATPMYGGNCKGVYTASLISLMFALAKAGHDTIYSKIYNESLITRARNSMVHEFMKTDADAMLFIDSDHGFEADDILKMIESGKQLIGAIYPMKNINWEMVRSAAIAGEENLAHYSGFFSANLAPGTTEITLDQPLEVSNVATGMMFIHRSVFEKMKPSCATYAHHGHDGLMQYDNQVVEYFKTDIDSTGVLLSEDYYFCHKWRDNGGAVYAAPWVRITHAGEYEFSGNFAMTARFQARLEQDAADTVGG